MSQEILDSVKSLGASIDTAKAEAIKAGSNATEAIKLANELKSKVDGLTFSTPEDVKAAKDEMQAQFDKFVTEGKKTTNVTKGFKTELAENMKAASDGFAKMAKEGKGSRVDFELKAVGDMTFANNFSTADTSVTFVRPGIIELPKRKLHLRELLVSGGMGAKSNFDYVKEVAGEGSIAPAAEGATKAQIDLDLVESSVKAEWIAGFLRISRNMLDDVEGMTTFLGSRLPELLLRAEDTQILSGTGTSPQLSGITTAGNFTAFGGAATIDVEQLVQAISQLEGYDREATGILINPSDYYNIMLTKASGSGEYDFPSLVKIENGAMFIAGVPVFKSTAMTVDKFLVGDWAMGANLIFREPAKLQFFFEDGTNVRENKVTVRIEERVALPIYGDNYFVYGDFGNIA
jgi:HK97 family phage major capsid protein